MNSQNSLWGGGGGSKTDFRIRCSVLHSEFHLIAYPIHIGNVIVATFPFRSLYFSLQINL
jgi:hypothetical protein